MSTTVALKSEGVKRPERINLQVFQPGEPLVLYGFVQFVVRCTYIRSLPAHFSLRPHDRTRDTPSARVDADSRSVEATNRVSPHPTSPFSGERRSTKATGELGGRRGQQIKKSLHRRRNAEMRCGERERERSHSISALLRSLNLRERAGSKVLPKY